jgi:hypothetical protein
MAVPKKKNDINVYTGKELLPRRQQLLDSITKSDTYLPDPVLHDDLDMGMLEFVKNNLKVVSDNKQIPVIPRILTIQRWSQVMNTWEFSDEDNNLKVPFIGVIRRPDVQPGTNPSIQRTIPERLPFHYATVATWNGTQMGADVYKIPQPVAVDITYDVTIVCSRLRELNRFNKVIMQKFASRQAYTMVKGHYVPIVMDKLEDNSPIDQIDGRRYYLQNYTFTLLGFLIDEEEFEVKPAISRSFLLNEFIEGNSGRKTIINKLIELSVMTFIADGMQTQFSVGESIGILFSVTINGLIQERDVDYFHIAKTSKITFATPPFEGSTIIISYYKGNKDTLIDNYGRIFSVTTEYFTYNGSSLTFQLQNEISSIISLDVNGLQEEENQGFDITSRNEVTLNFSPAINSRIGVTYLY